MQQPICFLIDDDEDDREIFTMALNNTKKPYQCITAKNGIDAVNTINSDIAFHPAFIFIDLNMPYMSGKECLEIIKNNERFTETPVVVYTTSSYNRDIEETSKLGAAHFIVKPPGISSLTKILSDILSHTDLPFYIAAED